MKQSSTPPSWSVIWLTSAFESRELNRWTWNKSSDTPVDLKEWTTTSMYDFRRIIMKMTRHSLDRHLEELGAINRE